VILTAAYVLWTVQRVYLGTNENTRTYEDMSLAKLSLPCRC